MTDIAITHGMYCMMICRDYRAAITLRLESKSNTLSMRHEIDEVFHFISSEIVLIDFFV